MSNEQDLIDMGKEFKEIVEKKNKELAGLKKILCMSYGLVRIMTEHEDMTLLEVLREELSNALTDYLGVEELPSPT